MNLPFDEDYLREMELWPLFDLRRQSAMAAAAGRAEASAPSVEIEISRKSAVSRPDARPPPQRAAVQAGTPIPAAPDPIRVARIAQLDWDSLKREAASCQSCLLCKQRKQAVLGVGAPGASWLFVGEGPGVEEDELGEPFVGQAGKLLDAMLTAAGLQRGREVYIANVEKCRPPGNRNPSADEVQACAPLLDRQIDLIKPKIIVALGKVALARLTGSEASMASMRSKLHEYRGIPVVATYHPAYLLRNLPDKLKAWEDLMFAKRAFVANAG